MAKLGYLETIAKWMSKYGPTFICYYGIKPIIMTEDLEIIKSVMVKNFDSFINRTTMPWLLNKEKVPNLFRMWDEQWCRVHRIVTPTFSSKKLRMMSPLIQESCERLRNKMVAISGTDNSVDVWEWFGIFTMEVILATAFSRDISPESGKENPLTRAAAAVFQSGRSGSTADMEKVLTILSHFPWCVPLLRLLISRTKFAQNWNYLEKSALKLIEDR